MSTKVLRAMRAALQSTISRCHDPANRQYHLYGGRGITVCERWRNSFEDFLADMGVRPEGLTLERVDNNLGYEKANCAWVTRLQQAQNRRANKLVTWLGKTQCISAWERELGMSAGTLKARLGPLGYDLETAFTKPVKPGAKVPGRAYRVRRNPPKSLYPRGLAHPATKLTLSDVEACVAQWRAGSSFSALCRKYHVSVTTMSNACQGLGAYTRSPHAANSNA